MARASWYGTGLRRAGGEPFHFAHLTMAFGTRVRFCAGDRCVEATCTDRGPQAWTGKQFDLSTAAFAALAPLSAGVITVSWEVL